ncbi:hypothetical protein [Flavobacterium rhizosphaerae]|uniref:Uncharacterized protein n=1 Tax=Flavobacterium rhizosphaerae TaxID=3163298 RepID=A0ABW8YXX7_9FLAO
MSITEKILAIVLLLFLLLLFFWAILVSLPPYKKFRRDLISGFRQARAQSIKLQSMLKNYIEENNAAGKKFTEDMTYGNYYKYLKSNYISYLSNKNYSRVKTSYNPIVQLQLYRTLKQQKSWLNDAEDKLYNTLNNPDGQISVKYH